MQLNMTFLTRQNIPGSPPYSQFFTRGKAWEQAISFLELALFPGLHHLQLHNEHRGPGIFHPVSDVKGRKTYLNIGTLGLRTSKV